VSLTALNLARFKAFADSQRIPIRPITLIFGANSAGKSSIIHALALAHHALETGDLDVQRTQVGGESIDLGGFRQYVHRHERDRRVDLVLELDPARLEGRAAQLLRSARTLSIEISIGAGFTSEQADLFGDAAREVDRELAVRVEAFTLRADGEVLVAMSARRDGLLRLDRLEHGHPVLREIITGLLALSTTTTELRTEDFDAVAEALDALVPEISARVSGLLPRLQEPTSESNADESPDLVAVSRGRRGEDLARAARTFFPRTLRQLVNGVAEAAEAEIRKLQYLGPLRSYPPRHLAFSQHHDANWFAGGGYAWDVVRQRRDVRERINAWLGSSRLKSPYEVVVRDLVALDQLQNPIEGALEMLAADGLDLEPEYDRDGSTQGLVPIIQDLEAEVTRVVEAIGESDADRVTELILRDLRTRTVVSHRDVGIGVSQVLPVLVAAYASRDRLLAIEQPEIHLHPALQAELGDVFIESALGELGNTFLLETHSEHLLLRIMRRMRETSSGDLPDGATRVCPEDVMVLFVEPDGSQSLVREMPLNERGELVKAWPGGFFEEGMREIF
jgi:hypothetical protein